MIPVDQTEYGPHGNCFAACVASILECSIDQVPNFVGPLQDETDPVEWERRFLEAVHAWLAPRALGYVELYFASEGIPETLWRNLDLLGFWVGIGSTKEGFSHAVVMRGREVAHDPSPDRTGLSSIHGAGFFAALDPRLSRGAAA